jgi:Tetratricopeptide repeat
LTIKIAVRAPALALLLSTLSGCAGLFGPPAEPAPIEDRAGSRPTPTRASSAPVAKAIPLPEQPRLVMRSPQSSSAPARPRLTPAPQLAMTDKSPQRPLSNLPLGAEPLPPEDLTSEAIEELGQGTVATMPAAPAVSPAVQSLLAAANTAAAQRDWDQAQAALERAVKLAPAKSMVWQQLARTHLQSGDVERAREVAQRALSLAAADGRENVAAWRLIADIEQARGDAGAAQTARTTAARLMQ